MKQVPLGVATALTSSNACASEFAELYVYQDGPHLVEKAKQIVEQLDKDDFNGSNGWLEK